MNGRLNHVIIAGGGSFAMQAANYFKKKGTIPIFIDPDENCMASENAMSIPHDELVKGIQNSKKPIHVLSSIENAFHSLNVLDPRPIYLVPAAPVNIMAKIFVTCMTEYKIQYIQSSEMLSSIFNCAREKDDYTITLNEDEGVGIISYAPEGKICPPSCPGSIDHCPHRGGRVERQPLFANLRACANPATKKLENWIFESRQLAPGVGGIPWDELVEFNSYLQVLKENEESRLNIMVGTACNCHGVLNGFVINP